MIIIRTYGLDPYIVGRIARQETDEIIRVLELENEEVIFIAPAEYIFHRGVEQTSWQAVIYVECDTHLTKKIEEDLADILLSATEQVAINTHIQFVYFEHGHSFGSINAEYPRFITSYHIHEDDEYNEENEDYEEEQESEDDHRGYDEVFMGDVFAGHDLEKSKDDKQNNCDKHD